MELLGKIGRRPQSVGYKTYKGYMRRKYTAFSEEWDPQDVKRFISCSGCEGNEIRSLFLFFRRVRETWGKKGYNGCKGYERRKYLFYFP